MAALDDDDFYQATIANNEAGRKLFYKALDELGLSYYQSNMNFIFIELGQDAEPLYQKMLRKGVIVRPLAGMGHPTGLRITMGLPKENERTIAALKECL